MVPDIPSFQVPWAWFGYVVAFGVGITGLRWARRMLWAGTDGTPL